MGREGGGAGRGEEVSLKTDSTLDKVKIFLGLKMMSYIHMVHSYLSGFIEIYIFNSNRHTELFLKYKHYNFVGFEDLLK